MRERLRPSFRLLATTVLVPLAVLALGSWEVQRGAADWADCEAERLRLARIVTDLEARAPRDGRIDFGMQFSRDGQTYVGPLALDQARDARGDAAILTTAMRLRRSLPPFVAVPAAVMAGLSALTLLAGAALGCLGRRSREALVRGFALVRRVLPVVLAAQVVLATVAFVAAVVFEAAALARPGFGTGEVKMLLLAGLAVLGSLAVAVATLAGLKRALVAFEPDPLRILGRRVSPAEAPGRWRLVAGLAERLGALEPDSIVVGLTRGFFVSAGVSVIEPGGETLSGRTLYLPLPHLPLLRVDELASIIGHELAHFSGGDTAYSLRFLPIYAGVERSLDAVAAVGAGSGDGFGLLSSPMRLGLFVMDQFHRAVRHWSRAREFAADAAGATATSPQAAVRALLRTGTIQPRIDETLSEAARHPGTAPGDLVAAVFDRVLARGLDDSAAHLDDDQTHPTDTHPPTRERILALAGALAPDLLAGAAAMPPRGALGGMTVYFADPAGLFRAATGDFLAGVRRREEAFHARLTATAAQVDGDERALRENTRPGAAFFVAAGAVLVLAALALAVLGLPGLSAEEVRLLAALTLAAGAVLAGAGAVMLWRGERVFLVLRADGLIVPGLDRPIPWDEVADLDVARRRTRMVTRILLPRAPFPRRVAGGRRIRLDDARRIVTVTAGLPRGMRPRDVAALVGRYRQAAEARRLLAERNAAASTLAGEAPAAPIAPEPPGFGAAALPSLSTVGRGWRQTLWAVLGILMLGALLAAAVVYIMPPLISDWQVQAAARPMSGARVTDGRCSSQLVFQVCGATLDVPTASGTLSRRVNYLFTGVHVGERDVRVMADPDRPELATVDMALAGLWNRTITLIAALALLLAGTIVPTVAMIHNRRPIAAAR